MISSCHNVQFDGELLQKYNQAVPRYTSYPPATEMTTDFTTSLFQEAIAQGNRKQTPLSLYCHIPFCQKPCYFCGCNTIITQHKPAAADYLGYLIQNIHQVSSLVSSDRPVQQLHWGGGTPNYLTLAQVETLWHTLQQVFTFEEDAEISIEINPCEVDREYIFKLRELGFKRVSFGIQDFNTQVQEAVNRIQPEDQLFQVMQWIREANFESVNVDLIYGLPYQTLETFTHTIQKTIELDPDRIAVFSFAYVPWLKPLQKRMPQEAMPSAAEKLKILQMTIAQLTANNYVFIGMDHFAKPNDELAIAQEQGQLHRNFQGYTTKPESDLLSFGMTAISMLQNVYVQNHKGLKDYYSALDNHQFPIERGVQLNQDDVIRRTLIMELMCQFKLSISDLEAKYHLGLNLDFNDYFQRELLALNDLEKDGLVQCLGDGFKVTDSGRLLVRNIASAFDSYLGEKTDQKFSKAI